MTKLNPNAKPFLPAALLKYLLETEERSLFMTFSSGLSLKNLEIHQFFNSVYGDHCVEYVYVHNQGKIRNPVFGKIIFRSERMANYILKNREVVQVMIHQKPIWLKKYVPRIERRKMGF